MRAGLPRDAKRRPLRPAKHSLESAGKGRRGTDMWRRSRRRVRPLADGPRAPLLRALTPRSLLARQRGLGPAAAPRSIDQSSPAIADEDDEESEEEEGSPEAAAETDNVGDASVEINVEELIHELEVDGVSRPGREQAAKRRLEELMEKKRSKRELEDFDDYEV